jgi:hypothetical protein
VELTPAQRHADELLEALQRAIRETPARYTDERNEVGDRVARQPEWVTQALAAIAKATNQGEQK